MALHGDLALQCPRTEVLAVVRQDAVAAFAQARACALQDFAAIEARRIVPNPDAAAMSELLQRNVLHRSAPQSVGEACVVNDATITGIDAVVTVERAWSDEVRGDGRFFTGLKQ